MSREVTKVAPSVEEAVDAALEELGVQQDAVEYEVIDQPGKGLFGAAGKPAKVRVWLRPGAITDEIGEEGEEFDSDEAPSRGDSGEIDLSDEELDAIADAGVETIQRILKPLAIEATIEEYEGDEGEIILDIVGDDLGLLIGRHGRTLDALQVLVSAITNRQLDTRYPLIVDVSGYRHRRRTKVEEIARRAADRVARQGRSVQLRPMSSFERRIVHVALRDDRRVTTESEGQDPRRMVVIHPR